MEKDIIVVVISVVLGGVATLLGTLIVEKRKEKREERIEARNEKKKILEDRPELAIVEYKDYIEKEGYDSGQKSDIELFVARIEEVKTTGTGKDDGVYAYYRSEDFNKNEWCCVEYTFKNVGKTDVSIVDIICNYKKDTCIFGVDIAEQCSEHNMLNYAYCYDKKVRVGKSFTVKFYYHKERIITGMMSAIMSVGLRDDNGRYWTQPLFAPNDRIYDSRQIPYKEYHRELLIDTAVECFKKPMLW